MLLERCLAIQNTFFMANESLVVGSWCIVITQVTIYMYDHIYNSLETFNGNKHQEIFAL